MIGWARLANGGTAARADLAPRPWDDLRAEIAAAVDSGAHLAAFFGVPHRDGGAALYAVLASEADGAIYAACANAGSSFASLTPRCPQAHLFEREIAESCGARPEGHPWLKPVRFPGVAQGDASVPATLTMAAVREAADPPLAQDHRFGAGGTAAPPSAAHGSAIVRTAASVPACGVMDFFQVAGEEVHEVAVGPVHAGVIEPGHFRFQCHGEVVHHLEISLGYQHRGVERALRGGPHPRTLHHVETLAGDATVAHATAYCRLAEGLARLRVPARAQALRGMAQELERLACHIGDLGALAGDVAFLPAQSYCGRVRGDALNMTAVLCGNRFGRGLVVPGGCGWDLDAAAVADLRRRLADLRRDATRAIELLFAAPSVLARFEGVGALDAATCRTIGLVGVAARACGVARDVRHDFPYGIFQFTHVPVCTWDTGDVFARAYVRWLEVRQSLAFVEEQLAALPAGPVCGADAAAPALAADRLAVALTESWRGEACHVALTDASGRFEAYKVYDPSFHNWFGLALALRNQQISDFPLCNKSFNLSYCGHDL